MIGAVCSKDYQGSHNYLQYRKDTELILDIRQDTELILHIFFVCISLSCQYFAINLLQCLK